MKEPKNTKCCICGQRFDGWENNPWPVKMGGECCWDCDVQAVLPARLRMIGIPPKNEAAADPEAPEVVSA